MAFLRARDIESQIKNRGMEKGTVYCLQVLAEQQIALQRDMRELADSVNLMANIVQSLTHVGEQMKMTIEKLNSEHEDDLDINTQALGDKSN